MRIKPLAPPDSLAPLPAPSRDLIQRARSILAPVGLAASLPVKVAQIPITCTRTGITSLGHCRDDTGQLVLVSLTRMRPTRGGQTAPSFAGVFHGVTFPDDFRCPGCRRPHSGHTWICDCSRFGGSIHTCGENNRPGFCFCGQKESRVFEERGAAEVRGASYAVKAALPSSLPPRSMPTQLQAPPRLLLPGKR